MIPGAVRPKEEETSDNKAFFEAELDDGLRDGRFACPSSSGKPQDITSPSLPVGTSHPIHNLLDHSDPSVRMAFWGVEPIAGVVECGVGHMHLQ